MHTQVKTGFTDASRSIASLYLLWYAAIFFAVVPASDSWASTLAAGTDHTAVIQSDGSLWVWGGNRSGQLGDGTLTDRLAPNRIGTGWASVSAGRLFTVAVKSDGTLWTWGINGYGQLGDGTLVDRTSPVQIGTDSDWVAVSAGWVHTLALKSNGTLWSWGRNQACEVGNGTKIIQPFPIQIGMDTDWAMIGAGSSHSVAVKTNGQLWAWGSNSSGQLGDGTTDQECTPVRIGSDSDWSSIAAGQLYTIAVKANGTLWGWGDNLSGQLGNALLVNSLAPVQAGSDSDWVSVSSGRSHAMAMKSNGTLWAWGENTSGQVGDGTTTNQIFPVGIGLGSEWKASAAGDSHTIAVLPDGSAWAWGANSYGQLGDGTVISRLLPAPIEVETVTPIAGMNGSMSPSGSQDVNWGAKTSFTLVPDAGYRIDTVTGCGGTLSGDIYTTGPVSSDCEVRGAFIIKTYAVTAQAGPNGSISPAGIVMVEHGSSAGYTITPSEGYSIGNVQVDGRWIGAVSSYVFVNVTGEHAINAVFVTAGSYTIIAEAGPNGTISPSGTIVVPGGTNKVFTITANTGYRATVVVDGVNLGTLRTYTFTNVTATHTISAAFSPTITSSAGYNGSISPRGNTTVEPGSDITYTMTPSAGYHVDRVLVDGVVVGPITVQVIGVPLSQPYTYTFRNVTAPHTLSAEFASNPAVIITATAGANGTISPSGEVPVLTETSKTFIITPASGFKVSTVVVDGVNKGAITSYTFTNIMESHTISAAFSPTITSSAGYNGSISPRGMTTLQPGSDITYTLTPAIGYHVADIVVDGVSSGITVTDAPLSRPVTYTFTNVTVPHAINAEFAPNPTMIITATAGSNGTISPSGEVAVLSETSKTFIITPASGFKVSSVVVDGVNQGTLSSYTFSNVTVNHTISAAFSPTIVSSAGLNGSISPRGTTTLQPGSDITYTLTPAIGYHVADVVVDGVSSGITVTDAPLSRPITYTFTNVTAPHTIRSEFAPNPMMIITATAEANGTINPSGEVSVLSETNKMFTISPASGFKVRTVVVDGVNKGAITSYTFTNVTESHTISAAFSPTIVSSAGLNGSISPRGTTTVQSGSDITYTLTPAIGYHVADVVIDGVSSGITVTDAPLSRPITYTFTNVTAPHTIRSEFAPNPMMIITATAEANGTINPSGEVSVLSETNKMFTISPASGFKVSTVVVDGVNKGAITSYTFTNVTESHTISAAFSPTIVSSAGLNGSISPRGATAVQPGSDITYTMTPSAGYHVDRVLVDGVLVGPVTVQVIGVPLSQPYTYTFSNVIAPHTISAEFAPNPTMIITATAGSNGTISPSGEVSVLSETNKSFSIWPDTGYRTGSVLVDGVNQGAISYYNFTNITENHTISATFSPTITSSAGSNGSISPRGTTTVQPGSDMTYTITPYAGYHVAEVIVDGVSIGAVTSYTFTDVTVPHTISAGFAMN